ncbi:MAG: peptidylprolyl isomerase [Bacteroidia bacterium]|nr:peptidylprolyl isomerase [Bacteroidia bacterium]
MKISLRIVVFFYSFPIFAQTIDKSIAVVGKLAVFLSDVQNAMLIQERNEMPLNRCKALEEVLFRKLLVVQADKDSVTVSDAEVENELNKRLNFFINQFGSERKLEEFYGKRTNVIKDEMRADVEEQLLAQKMQQKIFSIDKLTPAEVRHYYESLPADSLPLVSAEYEIQQIIIKPEVSPEAKQLAREKLEGLRERVLKGESMSTLAKLYSEDPGSSHEGGLIENVYRGQMDPAFESVAFRLKPGEVSKVFESSFGYHFIQLVARKGELLDLRHILIIPKMTNSDYYRAKLKLDSVRKAIKEGKLDFENAVRLFSSDKESKNSNGLLINPASGTTKWEIEDLKQIDPKIVFVLNNMNPGDISDVEEYQSFMDQSKGFRIIKLKSRTDPHRANLKDDYQKIMNLALADKKRKFLYDYIKRKSKYIYIRLDDDWKKCRFEYPWHFQTDNASK